MNLNPIEQLSDIPPNTQIGLRDRDLCKARGIVEGHALRVLAKVDVHHRVVDEVVGTVYKLPADAAVQRLETRE